ncbi:unnamed protein product [Rotaria socialis]|uniref:Death domain-containing protein n=1 Tax=Rotaria socialis TaxID=392032 RepID=A0A820MWT7_9BILA|nr:unnamed protein product [Rotaria socialis]CAF3322904.1 unnamed protein product [Rotaria socialis]CAF3413283.1 unnamed protein product [Rotaria socialis]CAF3516739.1 unnamed protein product [Rotaria socialis]CAF3785500.1 unnamed protein product [Rotaria socialis]
MGAILNQLSYTEVDTLENTSPDRGDWLTNHADATGLATVEVERLWRRFRQITESDDETILYLNDKPLPKELPNDIFVRNFLQHFPRSKLDHEAIPFGHFIMVMFWLDGASLDAKLVGVFLYLNNGGPITAPMIAVLLRYLYTDIKDSEIKPLSIQCMKQLGSNEKGELNQKQFVEGVKRLIPRDELEEILGFNIIPAKLLDEVNRLPSPQLSVPNPRSKLNFHDYDLVSNDELQKISLQASRKNWPRLAYTLGFLEYDVEAYQELKNYDSEATIYALLQIWREEEGDTATKQRLREALSESELDELIPILN